MSRYNAEFPFPMAFPPQPMTNVLAEWLSKQGLKQSHIAGNTSFFFFRFVIDSLFTDIVIQKQKSTPTLPSSSMEGLRNNSNKSRDT